MRRLSLPVLVLGWAQAEPQQDGEDGHGEAADDERAVGQAGARHQPEHPEDDGGCAELEDEATHQHILPDLLLPGEDPEDIFGAYPIYAADADGNEVPIFTTAGNSKYLGRADIVFDADGNVIDGVTESSYPRRVISLEQSEAGLIEGLGFTVAVESDPDIISSVIEPLDACLTELAATPVAISDVVLNVDRGQFSLADGVFSPGVRASQADGGTIIADAFTSAYDLQAASLGLEPRRAENLVVTLQNGGGIRQNAGPVLPMGGTAGDPITQLDTIDVLPFLNSVSVVGGLTAEDFAATLQTACESRGGGGFMQASGVSYTCDYSGASVDEEGNLTGVVLRDTVIDAGDGSTVADVDAEGVVDTSVGPISVITNSFTAGGGDGYDAFSAATDAENVVNLRADDDAQITYERAFREYLEAFDPGDDGIPVISVDDPVYADELSDGRITLIDG